PTSVLPTIPSPPPSPLFPYTTLFRSSSARLSSTSGGDSGRGPDRGARAVPGRARVRRGASAADPSRVRGPGTDQGAARAVDRGRDRKSTRLNSSHVSISYAVFCLKKK